MPDDPWLEYEDVNSTIREYVKQHLFSGDVHQWLWIRLRNRLSSRELGQLLFDHLNRLESDEDFIQDLDIAKKAQEYAFQNPEKDECQQWMIRKMKTLATSAEVGECLMSILRQLGKSEVSLTPRFGSRVCEFVQADPRLLYESLERFKNSLTDMTEWTACLRQGPELVVTIRNLYDVRFVGLIKKKWNETMGMVRLCIQSDFPHSSKANFNILPWKIMENHWKRVEADLFKEFQRYPQLQCVFLGGSPSVLAAKINMEDEAKRLRAELEQGKCNRQETVNELVECEKEIERLKSDLESKPACVCVVDDVRAPFDIACLPPTLCNLEVCVCEGLSTLASCSPNALLHVNNAWALYIGASLGTITTTLDGTVRENGTLGAVVKKGNAVMGLTCAHAAVGKLNLAEIQPQIPAQIPKGFLLFSPAHLDMAANASPPFQLKSDGGLFACDVSVEGWIISVDCALVEADEFWAKAPTGERQSGLFKKIKEMTCLAEEERKCKYFGRTNGEVECTLKLLAHVRSAMDGTKKTRNDLGVAVYWKGNDPPVFRNQVLFDGKAAEKILSFAGDSGSVIWTADNSELTAVGMVEMQLEGTGFFFGVMSPIAAVIAKLDCTFEKFEETEEMKEQEM